jgi:hypothetical protein
MKKIILLFCCLFAVTAYAQTANDLAIQLSGVQKVNEVSIPQVLDFPKLLTNDKAYTIISYKLTVLPADATTPTSFVVKDNKMPQEAIIYLRSLIGKKGKLFFENIIVSKAGQQRIASSLTYSFNQ